MINIKKNVFKKKYNPIVIFLMIMIFMVVSWKLVLMGFALEGDHVNQRLTVELNPRGNKDSGKSGESLYAKVISTYSKANDTGEKVNVSIRIGQLPEGVTIEGFIEDKMQVVYLDGNNNEQRVTLVLKRDEKGYYIEYEQPQGSVLEFDLQFSSSNGIMPSDSSLTLSVDKDKISGLDTPLGDNDSVDDTCKLNWTAENNWDNVSKKVNDADENIISSNNNSKLSDDLYYSITANSLNNNDTGDIWTDHIIVEDTLTLSDNIKFPEGTKIEDSCVKDSSGNIIFNFLNLQGGTVENIKISDDRSKIDYVLKIPNRHRNEINGAPTKEQDNLFLEAKLDTSKLVLPNDYNIKENVDTITNNVTIKPQPYKEYDVKPSSDSVVTTVKSKSEDFELEKTADKIEAKPNEVINYTIKVNNTGSVPIKLKDKDGNPYVVTDTLPNEVHLTDEQIKSLPSGVTYDNDSRTLSWIMDGDLINVGEHREITFAVTVNDEKDIDKDCTHITNNVKYKDKLSNVSIEYLKEKFELKKSSDNESVKSGDVITYTISLTNTGKVDLQVKDESGQPYKVKDKLPNTLYLTESQIQDLRNKGLEYNESDRTISWIPSTSPIIPGEVKQISFDVTVSSDPNVMNGIETITNTAEFKDQSASEQDKYEKPPVEVTKNVYAGEDNKVSNGELITYTIIVKNSSDFDSLDNIIVTDKLAQGLTFDSWKLESSSHDVKFNQDGQDLSWNLGVVKAKEEIKIVYTCKVDTDKLIDKNKISNTVNILGSSSSVDVDVDYPIDIEKTVDKNTDDIYGSGQEFKYTITVTNDKDNPSKKDEFILKDTIPNGMLPTEETLFNPDKLINKSCKWSELPKGSTGYVATVGGREVAVSREDDGDIVLEWKLEKIKAGESISITYPVKLISDEIRDFTNKAEVDGQKSNVTIHGGKDKNSSIDIQKNVWQIYEDNTYTKPDDNNKKDFKAGKHKYISYDITVVNTGEEDVYLDTIIDELPKGITYLGLRNTAWDNGKKVQSIITKQYGQANDFDRTNLIEGIKIERESYDENSGIVKFSIDKDKGGYNLKAGKAFTFLVFCEINENAEEDVELINTAKVIVDKRVQLKDYPEMQTTNTGNDTYQNNGGSKDEGIQEGKRVISSSVGITARNGVKSVDLQKSVWKIIKESNDNPNDNYIWHDKELFTNDDDKTNVVIYNLTVVNTGESNIHINSMSDELPQGMKYRRLDVSSYISINNIKVQQDEIKTEAWGKINDYDGNKLVKGIKVKATTQDNTVILTLNDGKGVDLGVGEAFTFLLMCEVDKSVEMGVPLNNTAKVFTKSDVTYSDYKEINTKTQEVVDAVQNNGQSKDEGIINDERVVSSSVLVTPEEIIVPGISKQAISYITPGTKKEVEINEDTNIQPNSTVKWEINLYNDGTVDMIDYSVKDVITPDFHFITKSEADRRGVSQPYTFTLYDNDGNKKGETIDISSKVFETIKDGNDINNYEFIFDDHIYTIPRGCMAKLIVYTNNNVQNFKVYENKATILPKQSFNANQVRNGELEKNEDGVYVGVSASDQVNALGEYASVSWKTITEKSNINNTAKGTDDKNFITLGQDSKMVTYRNNVKNVSGKGFNNLVLIDVFPYLDDTGVINKNDKRGSEFRVEWGGNERVYIINEDGTIVDVNAKFEFSSKRTFEQADFDKEALDEWHDEWQDGDYSFRVILPKDLQLGSNQTIVVEYDGIIENEAKPGDIAWNSFGYQYESETETAGRFIKLKAEPPKVGVRIPAKSVISKEVVDTEGNILDKDDNIKFKFIIDKVTNTEIDNSELKYEHLGTFELGQGGHIELENLISEDGQKITLENGQQYRIREDSNMNDNYSFVSIGEEGKEVITDLEKGFTFTYYPDKNISIVVRNMKNEYYDMPSTGGHGTKGYFVGGFIIMSMAVLIYIYKSVKSHKKN